jgi:hypothetical protein
MKLTNAQIWVAVPAIKGLMGQKLPVQTSMRLVRLAQELDTHLAVISGVRNNLIKQYGKEENGQVAIKPNTEEMEVFSKDWADLMSSEIDVVFGAEKIKLPWTVNIEPSALISLEPFIDIEEG